MFTTEQITQHIDVIIVLIAIVSIYIRIVRPLMRDRDSERQETTEHRIAMDERVKSLETSLLTLKSDMRDMFKKMEDLRTDIARLEGRLNGQPKKR